MCFSFSLHSSGVAAGGSGRFSRGGGGAALVCWTGASGGAPAALGDRGGVSQHVQQSKLEGEVLVAQASVLRVKEAGVRFVPVSSGRFTRSVSAPAVVWGPKEK